MNTVILVLGVVLIVFVSCICIIAFYLGIRELYRRNLEYIYTDAVAKVTKKQYKKVPFADEEEGRYIVCIEWENLRRFFDDEDIFKMVKVGDEIHVRIGYGFNKKGKVKDNYIEAPDDNSAIDFVW